MSASLDFEISNIKFLVTEIKSRLHDTNKFIKKFISLCHFLQQEWLWH